MKTKKKMSDNLNFISNSIDTINYVASTYAAIGIISAPIKYALMGLQAVIITSNAVSNIIDEEATKPVKAV